MSVALQHPGRKVESIIMKLAADQHGLVTRAQLLRAGITLGTIKSRLRSGRFVRIHSGVFHVGPITAPHQREMAAVLACGPNAVLSHRSAAEVWKILPSPEELIRPLRRSEHKDGRNPVDVTIHIGRRRKRPGIRIHTLDSVRPDETTRHHNIPITTPERTLLDLASSATHRDLERAVAEAQALRLTTSTDIAALAAGHLGRPGAGILKRLVDADAQPAFTRSEAERRLLELVRKAGLGSPAVNARVAGYEVDFFWKDQRLIVEVDGRSFHVSDHAFERDRHRGADLTAQGYRVVHVTWRQIVNQPEMLLARLAQALVR